jgi:glucan phosphoethanolaminetransferase (alkaline phosphatase superfamily)
VFDGWKDGVFVLLGLIFLCFLIFFWIREGLLLSEMCTFVASFLTCFFSLFCSLLMLPTALTKPQSPFLFLLQTSPSPHLISTENPKKRTTKPKPSEQAPEQTHKKHESEKIEKIQINSPAS